MDGWIDGWFWFIFFLYWGYFASIEQSKQKLAFYTISSNPWIVGLNFANWFSGNNGGRKVSRAVGADDFRKVTKISQTLQIAESYVFFFRSLHSSKKTVINYKWSEQKSHKKLNPVGAPSWAASCLALIDPPTILNKTCSYRKWMNSLILFVIW